MATCTSPITIVNPKYKKLAEIFLRDKEAHYAYRLQKDYMLTVPCGHCLACLKKRQQHWFNRAHHIYKRLHLKPSDCYFCTFTIAPGPLYEEAKKKPYIPIRRYIDRLRKFAKVRRGIDKLKFDYYFVVEFADGETAKKRGLSSDHRMHYHAIFFRCPLSRRDCRQVWEMRDKRGIPALGIAQISPLRSESGVRYSLKYISKDRKECQSYLDPEDISKNGKLVVSHKFGDLSSEEIKCWRRYMLQNSKSFFCNYIGNHPYSIPRYWKNKCFDKEELEELHRVLIPPLLLEALYRDHPDWPEHVIQYVFSNMTMKWQ